MSQFNNMSQAPQQSPMTGYWNGTGWVQPENGFSFFNQPMTTQQINSQIAKPTGVGGQFNNAQQSPMGVMPPPSQGQFLGMGAEGWGNTIGGVQALGNMYLGYQGLQESKKQNKFSRNLASTNLANQATLVNNQLEDKAKYGYTQMSDAGKAEAGTMSQYSDAYVKQRGVRGTV